MDLFSLIDPPPGGKPFYEIHHALNIIVLQVDFVENQHHIISTKVCRSGALKKDILHFHLFFKN